MGGCWWLGVFAGILGGNGRRGRGDDSVSGSCEVTVIEYPATVLSASFTNADGKTYWAEFNTNALATWTASSSETVAYNGGTLANDRLIVNDGVSIYSVDPVTFAAADLKAQMGAGSVFSDAALSPAIGGVGYFSPYNWLYGVSPDGRTILGYNLDSNVWWNRVVFSSDPAVAIALAKIDRETATFAQQTFYVVAESGQVYEYIVRPLTEAGGGQYYEAYPLSQTSLDLTGANRANTGIRSSMIYDEATGYLLLTKSVSGEKTKLYAIDPLRGDVVDLGDFGDNVVA